jgi:SM-20-related protein
MPIPILPRRRREGYIFARHKSTEARLSVLDLDRLTEAPLRRDPFDFVVVEGFVGAAALPALVADFPPVAAHGSFPIAGLRLGPAFAELVAALEGAALRRAVADKFGVALDGRPTLITVRGHSDGKDGRIHTDSASKIITLLLYLNPVWEWPQGRLRLLRGPWDLDDFAVEVAPVAGTMLAFRRSERSYHGHRAHVGERRVLQLNWITEAAVVRRELRRHRWAARWKALHPQAWLGKRGQAG